MTLRYSELATQTLFSSKLAQSAAMCTGLNLGCVCRKNVACVFLAPYGRKEATIWHPEIRPISEHNDTQSVDCRLSLAWIPRAHNEFCVNCGHRLVEHVRRNYGGKMITYNCPHGCDHVSETHWAELMARTPLLSKRKGLDMDALTCWEEVRKWNLGSSVDWACGMVGNATATGDESYIEAARLAQGARAPPAGIRFARRLTQELRRSQGPYVR